MSGIAGTIHASERPVDQFLLAKMAGCLTLRGPDGSGSWTRDSAGLVYTLLGANGKPEDALVVREHLAIVADARVDAKDDLFQKFDPGDRIALRGATDTELILSCYQRWGDRCLDHLIGDFSFAIWDSRKRSLLCARDQFGVKPLFYASTGDSFVFSNTLDCLRVHPGIGPDLDTQAISDFLLFGQYQDSAATAFLNLRRLPAGHSLRWHLGATELRRYWTLPAGESTRLDRAGEYVAGFRQLLEASVADRVDSLRTSILMSGGLDSTMVAAVAAGQVRNIKSFALVYDRLIPDPERHYAQVAADALRLPLQCLAADDYRLFQRAPGAHRDTSEPVDEPVPAAFTDHLVQVQSHSNVALSGVGGDSLLLASSHLALHLLKSGKLVQLAGGLSKFVQLRRRIPPVGFRGAILRTLGLRQPPESPFPPWLNPDLVRDLGLRERWRRYEDPKDPPASTARPEAYKSLTDPGWARIFESYDAGFTRIPVEVRHPLFDVRLVNYCMSIPPIPWFVDKTLARTAMRNHLPDAIRLRPKSFAADAVAVRLPASPWVDDWKAAPELPRFVDRSRIPILTEAGAGWDPHHRPFALNQWLSRLTPYGG